MNGPDIPIAQKEFKDIQNILLINSDSIIPGFDIASAHLNNEAIEFEINVVCKENLEEFYKGDCERFDELLPIHFF